MPEQLATAIAAGGAAGIVIGIVLLLAFHRRLIFASLAIGCLLGVGAMAVPAEQQQTTINKTIIEKVPAAQIPSAAVPAPPEVRRIIRRRWTHVRPVAKKPAPAVEQPYLLWWMARKP